MDSSSSDCESVDSDKELQIAFQQGLLQPGLNIVSKVPEKRIVNDAAGLTQALQELQEKKKHLTWIERLDLTVDPAPAPKPMEEQLEEKSTNNGEDVHDDFKREMKFYRLAQAAVLEGLPRLQSMGVPTKRPEDYFAEMVKSDIQMKKIREKLMSKQISMERSAKAKKLRELRKYGKKVQQEVLLKRQQEKKEMMTQVKKFRKGQSDKLDFLDDKPAKNGNKRNAKPGEVFRPNKKREVKNAKYGYGGQKKRSKGNTADSAASFADYNKKIHGSASSSKKFQNQNKKNNSKKGKGANKRLGKARRQANKTTRK